MEKYYIIWIVCNLLAIVGCTNEGDNPVGNQKGIDLRNFSNSGCKSNVIRTRSLHLRCLQYNCWFHLRER